MSEVAVEEVLEYVATWRTTEPPRRLLRDMGCPWTVHSRPEGRDSFQHTVSGSAVRCGSWWTLFMGHKAVVS